MQVNSTYPKVVPLSGSLEGKILTEVTGATLEKKLMSPS